MSLLRRSARRAPQLSPLSLRHRRTFASRIDIPFTPSPVPVIENCPVPTCPCSAAPDGLQIEREQNINGSMAAYAEQVLLCTGRSDWASRIETEENADGEIVRQLKSFLGPGGKFSDVRRDSLVSACPLPNQPRLVAREAYMRESSLVVTTC